MRESRAAVAAGALAAGAYGVGLAVQGGRGPTERVVPLHAHLWDLVHGETSGDLLFNWGSGYGVPFLPDLFGSLLNPFSWLVVLLPRSAVGVGVLLATLLSIGLSTALMTLFLGRLRAGSPWLRGLLAVGYGLCGWVLVDGAGRPAWLWGPVSLPLLCLAFDRALRRERWGLGTLCVALAWTGDFSIALTATLGAALVLLLRLVLAGDRPVRDRLRALGRAVGMTAVGVGLVAPVLTVTFRAGRAAQPVTALRPGTPGLTDYLAQTLPGALTGGLSERALPNVFVGVLGLLLAAALPFHRAVPWRERAGWCVLLALAALSFAWRPAILLWHAPAAPEGDPYRSTFVLSGLLTMAAWSCLARRPDRVALAGGVAVVAVLALVARGHGSVRPITWVLLGVGVPLAVAALLLLVRGPRRVAAAALTLLVLAGSSWTVTSVTPPHGPRPDETQVRAARDAIRGSDHWPTGRTDPGPARFTADDPLLIGGEGGGYDSPYLPAVTAQTLHALGAGWSAQGRRTQSVADPVGQALLAVRGVLDPRLTVQQRPAPPLVTVHAPTVLDTSSVWSRQQALLGAEVYRIPVPAPFGSPAPTDHGSSGWSIPPVPPDGSPPGFTLSCPPGGTAYFYGPWFDGTVTGPGGGFSSAGRQNATAMPIHLLGTVPADGVVRLELRSGADSQVPALPVGCLDEAALSAAVARLTAGGAVAVRAGGHTISAALPAGSAGTAVFSLPVVPGWQCAVDGGPDRAPQSAEGLLAVPLGAGASRVACDYRQPGLMDGLAVAAAAAAALLTVAAGAWWQRRRLSRR